MKSIEYIADKVTNLFSKKKIKIEKPLDLPASEQGLGYLMLKNHLFINIYASPINEIEKIGIEEFYNKALMRLNDTSTKFILEQEKNIPFLKDIKDGTITLYNGLNNKENLAGKTFYNEIYPLIPNYLDSEAVRTIITFIMSGNSSYTSKQFMEAHNAPVVSKISEASEENTLYTYLFEHHWYMLFLKDGVHNVIDVDSKASYFEKKYFIDKHKALNIKISYLSTLNIQPAIEGQIGVENICGKICISINNYFTQKKLEISNENFSRLKKSFKEDSEFCGEFINVVKSLVRQDSIKGYSIDDEYCIYKKHFFDSPIVFTQEKHNEFITTLDSENSFFDSNLNIIKFIAFTLTAITGIYLIYNHFFSQGADLETDVAEHLIGDIVSSFEDL